MNTQENTNVVKHNVRVSNNEAVMNKNENASFIQKIVEIYNMTMQAK